jgi:hypothetical protein
LTASTAKKWPVALLQLMLPDHAKNVRAEAVVAVVVVPTAAVAVEAVAGVANAINPAI